MINHNQTFETFYYPNGEHEEIIISYTNNVSSGKFLVMDIDVHKYTYIHIMMIIITINQQ